ncbi:hypothetical protein M9H77_25619 [Catharanthus roseus]|uniref:Uncharacterized protein n=1 Tax=Catharanthus roseus TaxID=4058 RepID=A0ACC0A8A9_CATRO|nr:hypothetical protein M9H77_25619 [Catharanthus roseus]
MPVAPSHPCGAGTYMSHLTFNSLDTSYVQPPPGVEATSYAPLHPSVVGLSFDASPPSSVASSSVPHMPRSRTFYSDSKEYGDDSVDDVTPTHQLRFTPFDYQ